MFGRFDMTFLLRRKVFLLALLLIPLISYADDSEKEAVDIGEVRVLGRAEYESLESAGSFTTVIRPSEVERQTKTTSEILSDTVGVDVTDMGGEGQLSTVSIRGSSSEQVVVLVDGVRINSPLVGSVDFATIPLDSIDRIEVIRGASSAKFGTDAIGGVINIITKEARDKRALDFKLTGGSFETLKTYESWREPGDGWDFVLSHNHFSTGGDFTFRSATVTLAGEVAGPSQTFTRLHNASIMEDVLVKGKIDLTETAHLSLSNDFLWMDRQVPGTEIETTLLYPANPLEAHEEMIRDSPSIVLRVDELFTPSLSLEAGAAYLMTHDHFTDPSPAIGSPIDVTYITHSPEAYAELMHIADFDLASPSTSRCWASLASTLRTQYEYDFTDNKSPYSGAALMGAHTRNTISAFLEETLGLLDDRLLFIPQGSVATATGRQTRASWRAGIVGKPVAWLDIKANANTSFRYPNFSELYFPDQGYIRGNPDLEDERALSWDAGIIIHPKYASLELSFFQNRIDNQIIFVPISAVTIQPVNTYKVFTQGFEAAFSVDPAPWFHFDANYTWLDAHYAGSDIRLPGRPKNKANVYAKGKIWRVSPFGRLQYIGSFPVNTANTVWISGHTSIDLGVTLEISKYFYATMEAKDITNVQMYDAIAFPLPRRSYWVTVGAKI